MSRFKNSQKERWIENFPPSGVFVDENNLTVRCKFNFSYFDSSQKAGQNFSDWQLNGLADLMQKLVEFSGDSLDHWRTKKRLVVYDKFPLKSEFFHPKHVPHDIRWARFRLESAVRLVGFVLPGECQGKMHQKTKRNFDCNTFYVVFLDANHLFYKVEEK